MTDRRQYLEQNCGVCPAPDWLEACRAHLQATNEDTPESVFHQVLHSDLCDVVLGAPSDNENSQIQASAASQELNRAVTETTTLKKRLVCLPESFKLLVQVDELLDVSLNAEARISVGPAAPVNPTPIGNQRKRCLKMTIRDGYKNNKYVAMETRPIPNLSVNSKSGIKVQLRGPLEVRYGVLLWHPDNTTVLGGCVASLVQVQAKALQQAKRVAGIGVDPTIRALIWNPDTGEENDQQEGEHESRDLPAPPDPPPPAPATIREPPAPSQPPQSRAAVNSYSQRSAQQSSSSQRASFASTLSSQRVPAPPQSSASSRAAPATSSNRAPASNPYASRNPYASSSPCSSSIAAPSICRVTSASGSALSVSTAADEASRTVASGLAESPVDLITPTNAEAQDAVATLDPPPQQAAFSKTPDTSSVIQCSQDTTLTTATENSKPKQLERMSYGDLRNLLNQLLTDKELYRKYQDTVFVVSFKMIGKHTKFDIKKRQKKRRKGKDKYEYLMFAKMGRNQENGTITCKIASAFLEPLFGVPPGELRKMNKTDKEKSKQIVSKGGSMVHSELVTEKLWQVVLRDSCDDFFAKTTMPAIDGAEPILEVMCKHDS